jgi:hypothetical protein
MITILWLSTMIKKIFVLIILSIGLVFYHQNDNNDTPVVIPENKNVIKDMVFFTEVDKHRNISEDSVYADVLNHSKQEPYGDRFGRRINVHETSHGITSELRNFYEKALNRKLNVFYVLDSKCIVLEEPKVTMIEVTKNIPNSLQSYRYSLYFEKNIMDWNDMPSYIIDEWNSYILGSMSAVEDYNSGLINEKVDAVSGCLDFSIYAVCFAMTVYEKDREYWDSYPQFKNTIKFLLSRAEKTFVEGISIENFKTVSQINLHKNLLYNKECGSVKSFLEKEFNGYFLNHKN